MYAMYDFWPVHDYIGLILLNAYVDGAQWWFGETVCVLIILIE